MQISESALHLIDYHLKTKPNEDYNIFNLAGLELFILDYFESHVNLQLDAKSNVDWSLKNFKNFEEMVKKSSRLQTRYENLVRQYLTLEKEEILIRIKGLQQRVFKVYKNNDITIVNDTQHI